MLRKLLTGLFVVFVGSFGIMVSPLATNAANLPYDGKSPVATGCDNTGVAKRSKSFTSHGISGTVYLMFSTSCKTAWAYVKVNSVPSGKQVSASVTRNNDRKTYSCNSANGNGNVLPGQHSCYSAMVYDLNPNTSYATADVLAGCTSSGCSYGEFDAAKTSSY